MGTPIDYVCSVLWRFTPSYRDHSHVKVIIVEISKVNTVNNNFNEIFVLPCLTCCDLHGHSLCETTPCKCCNRSFSGLLPQVFCTHNYRHQLILSFSSGSNVSLQNLGNEVTHHLAFQVTKFFLVSWVEKEYRDWILSIAMAYYSICSDLQWQRDHNHCYWAASTW